jgi:large subunit ribosomal protein L30
MRVATTNARATAAAKAATKQVAVVRVRGVMGIRSTIAKGINMLGLTRKNHCVILRGNPSVMGMLNASKDYVAWGEPTEATVEALLSKAGKTTGDKPLTDKYVSENSSSKLKTVKELAKAIHAGTADASAVKGLKKVFRLNPPRKGYGASTKALYPAGACGNRGEKINELIASML